MKGALIFNLLPAEVRNIDSHSVDIFKTKLDKFLKNIPDQPTIDGFGRSAETNSLLDQIPQSTRFPIMCITIITFPFIVYMGGCVVALPDSCKDVFPPRACCSFSPCGGAELGSAKEEDKE